MTAALTVINAFAAGCLYGLLHGRKHDPYQAREDRARLLQRAWRGMVALSILLSAVYGIADAFVALELPFDYALFASSLFQQVVAVILATSSSLVLPFGPANFEVYRADTHPPTAIAT